MPPLHQTGVVTIQIADPRADGTIQLRQKLAGIGHPLDRGCGTTGRLETHPGRVNQARLAMQATLLNGLPPMRIVRHRLTRRILFPAQVGLKPPLAGLRYRAHPLQQTLQLGPLHPLQLTTRYSKTSRPRPGSQPQQSMSEHGQPLFFSYWRQQG